ncbi:phytoene/squalene synthase family protein [Fibrisoma montanum]|uniref:Phytoene/squalene synthase family protein n=1 Tax=Fibrisoma montanum TaxID=2305895 RepID=A0A418LWR5_9BACT|nr:phytoene/squalene synthase family protein [Fibrisoma montanum]RIV17697.1 phytoene/squalene synthase family protein [Fibrisoma montanum]
MSLDLFHSTAIGCSRLITQAYSTSFSIGVRLLNSQYRGAIYAIYGYVRLADELVDTFHQFDKAELFRQLSQETAQALQDGLSLNPVIHAFVQAVRRYRIDPALLDAFLNSMEMDLTVQTYQVSQYQQYVYGSAEVVGLMCLRVFCDGDDTLYFQLREPARRLGAAFQKVNFLRDIASDLHDRGRLYFPGVDFIQFKAADKQRIEAEITQDFAAALPGIVRLPRGVRLGVYVAYRYYLDLFAQLRRHAPTAILTQRVRVSNQRKVWILIRSSFRHLLLPVLGG